MGPIIAHKGKVIARNFMTQYPSGEPAWKPGIEVPDGSVIGLQWKGNMNEVVALCSWMSTTAHTPFGCTAVIPFLPCSRQDKEGPVEGDQSRGVGSILNMLHDSNIEKLVVLDNHSTSILKHYDGFVENQSLVSVLEKENGVYLPFDVVVSPDAGSLSRSHEVAAMYGAPVICASKVREQSSGRITSYSLPVAQTHGFKRILVVDDIIDGGYTFQLLAHVLRSHWPEVHITLVCTHGVLSAPPHFPAAMLEYNKVWLTDSCENAKKAEYASIRCGHEKKVDIIEVVERMTIERSLQNA